MPGAYSISTPFACRGDNTGKLGIVTGAESGIGRATVLRLAVELVTADVTTQKWPHNWAAHGIA
jgi:NAD(P)-dependent dehydrogenase (short-subunit alcohol dehydrogenase family)